MANSIRSVKVLVLDGHSSAALAVVRSLGRRRHSVSSACSEGTFAPALLSRYCADRWAYPDPQQNPERFVQAVRERVQDQGIDLVLPMTDATLEPLSRHRRLLHDCPALRLPGADVLILVSDKYRTVSLANELGIPVPRTTLVQSSADLRRLAEFSFPVVVKDRFSLRLIDSGVVHGTTAYAYSSEDLAGKVKERVEQAGDVLVQEFVPGVGVGFSFFAQKGQLYLPFQWQRIREKDPRGSGSAVRKSVPLDERVVRYGRELIGAVEFDGIGMVEFKQDPVSGRLVLMEINGRPWGSLQLPIHCGIDYPYHLVEWYLRGALPPKEIDYVKGITCRWLAADLAHLEKLWEGKPPGWPIEYPSFAWSLIKIAVPWYPGLRYDDLWLSDPKPGIAGIGQWLRSHFRKSVD